MLDVMNGSLTKDVNALTFVVVVIVVVFSIKVVERVLY